jgi:methionine-rich copper-binding protein CopC
MTARRRAATALTCLAALLAVSPSALGHSSIASTSPASGARLADPPAMVRVTYAQPLLSVESARVTVRGDSALAAPPRLDPADARRLLVPVRPAGPGSYHVNWIVVAADGHPLSGELRFAVRPSPWVLALHRVGAALRHAVATILGALPA